MDLLNIVEELVIIGKFMGHRCQNCRGRALLRVGGDGGDLVIICSALTTFASRSQYPAVVMGPPLFNTKKGAPG
jgi:hypothetical protein